MKLVRIDAIAPGGRPLHLHPRLTVLRGCGPEPRRRLESVLRAIAEGSEPGCAGVIEVSGVQLALEQATLSQLELDMDIDPVLVLSERERSAAPEASGSARLRVGSARAELRERLQALAGQLSDVADQLGRARSQLDPFANAALQTCVGRIEALERRRNALRSEWEATRRGRDRAHRELEQSIAALRSDLELASTLDPAPVLSARAAVVAGVEAPRQPDPDAAALADRIDGTLELLRELQSRRSQAEIRTSEAEQRLADAQLAVERAAASMRAPEIDRDVVQRLDAVRDEIFEVDDRHGRLSSARAKRRIQELRAEQAILLEQLGYDTYSAYVMGIPSTRAELERSAKLESAQDRVERISEELERLRAEAPAADDVERLATELQTLLVRAQRHVGPDDEVTVPLDVASASSAEAIYEIVAALRRRRLAAPGHDDPVMRAALADLRRALVTASWSTVELDVATAPGAPQLDDVEQIDATALLERSDRWLAWHRDVREWVELARQQLLELESQLSARPEHEPEPSVTRWAEVETELDEALDRLAEAQERVREHDAATDRVARLRTDELALRAQERDLLAELALVDQAPAPLAEPTEGPPPYRPDEATPLPEVCEWTLVARAARQRRVSFVGSLPLLVVDLEGVATPALCERLRRLAALVQTIVVADDPDLVERLVVGGSESTVIDLAVGSR